jgi:type II secretory pathway component PulK
LQHIDEIIQKNKDNFETNDLWQIKFQQNKQYKLENISLNIKVEDIDYDNIQNYIDINLLNKIQDLKLKKNLQSVGELLKDFSISTENLKI